MYALSARVMRATSVAVLLWVVAVLGSISSTLEQQRPMWLDENVQIASLVQLDQNGSARSITRNLWRGLSGLDHGSLRRIAFQSMSARVQRSNDEPASAISVQLVRPGFFATLQAELSSGRDFTEIDRTSTPVVIVHPTLLERIAMPPEHALGKSLLINGKVFQIIGIAHPAFTGLPQREAATAWIPFEHFGSDGIDVGLFLVEHQYALVYPRSWAPGQLRRSVDAIADQMRDLQQLPANTRLRALAPMLPINPAQHQTYLAATAAARWLVLALLGFYVLNRALGFFLFLQQQRRSLAIELAVGAPPRVILKPLLLELIILGAALLLALCAWFIFQSSIQTAFTDAASLALEFSFAYAVWAWLGLLLGVLAGSFPLLKLLHAPAIRSLLDEHTMARPLTIAVSLQAGVALAAIALVVSIAMTQLPRWQQTLQANDRLYAIEVRDLDTDRRVPLVGTESFAPLYTELKSVLGEADARWGLLSSLPGHFEPEQVVAGPASQPDRKGRALLAAATDSALALLGVTPLLLQPDLAESELTTLLPLSTAKLMFGSPAAALGQSVRYESAPGQAYLLKVRGIVSDTTWAQAGTPAMWRSSITAGSPRFFLLVDAGDLQGAMDIAERVRGVVPRHFPGFDVRRVLPFAPLADAFLQQDKQLTLILCLIALVLATITMASIRALWQVLYQQIRKNVAIASALGASEIRRIATVLKQLERPAQMAVIVAAALIFQGATLPFLTPLMPLQRAWLIPLSVLLAIAAVLVALIAFTLRREESRGIGLALREE